ncbi:MAG: ATP-binding cassette domain-containing protein [Pseudonocardia sp.]|nr:ATP-binding cassette domain-containing protein [Pseudonocardia sp.]
MAGAGIEGVIGPNVARKTTLFKLLAGFERPDRSEIHLGERRIDRMSAHARARAGIARTFQEQEVFLPDH